MDRVNERIDKIKDVLVSSGRARRKEAARSSLKHPVVANSAILRDLKDEETERVKEEGAQRVDLEEILEHAVEVVAD